MLQDAFLDAAARLDNLLRDPDLPAFLWLRLVVNERLATYHRRHLGARMRDAGREVSLYCDPMPQASSAALASMLLGRLTSPTHAAVRAERPSLKEYTDRYPELADEIRELFPALVRVEQAEDLLNEEPPASTPATRLPEQVGDYRILRELGRGGMCPSPAFVVRPIEAPDGASSVVGRHGGDSDGEWRPTAAESSRRAHRNLVPAGFRFRTPTVDMTCKAGNARRQSFAFAIPLLDNGPPEKHLATRQRCPPNPGTTVMSNSSTAQVIVALIGFAGTLVVEMLRRNQAGRAAPPAAITSAVGAEPMPVAAPPTWRRSILELANALMVAAFFSALLADSLLVSGRVPTFGLSSVITILGITVLTSSSLAVLWYGRKTELAVGALAVTTLVVLVMAPGGPFDAAAGESGNLEPGLSLFLPTILVVFLASTSAFSYFGNPLDRETPARSRRAMIAVLGALIVAGSIILAQQTVTDTIRNHNAPHVRSEAAQRLLESLREQDLQSRGLLYQLGSEIALNGHYRDAYFRTLESFRTGRPATQAATKGSTPPIPKAASNTAGRTERERFLTGRKQDLIDLNPEDSRFRYLADRISWVHPATSSRNDQLDLPLPGTTPEKRYETITACRVVYSLSSQPERVGWFLDTFRYPANDVTLALSPLRNNPGSSYSPPPSRPAGNGVLGATSPRWTDPPFAVFKLLSPEGKAGIFPQLPSRAYSYLLHGQLSLPGDEDSFLAYAMYRSLVPTVQGPGKVTEVLASLPGGNGDAERQRRALIHYVSDHYLADHDKGAKILATLARLAAKLGGAAELRKPEAKFPYTFEPDYDAGRLADLLHAGKAKGLSDRLEGDTTLKDDLVSLLQDEDPQYPVQDLLSPPSLAFLQDAQDVIAPLGDESLASLCSLLSDPVTPVVRRIAERYPPYQDADWLRDKLDALGRLDAADRDGILNHLAIATYRAQGPNSLGWLDLLVLQARSLSRALGFACAAVPMLPLVIGAMLLGGVAGRMLSERDRIRGLIEAECKKHDGMGHLLAHSVPLEGRQGLIDRLIRLSGRGWSTIAVAGRRGVGKSRVLYQIYRPEPAPGPSASPAPDGHFAVSLWISAPSRYDEEDFVQSMLEHLALNVEEAISRRLGADPIQVRRLAHTLSRRGLVLFVGVTAALGLTLHQIYERLQRPEAIITWFPIAMPVIAAFGLVVTHLVRRQPVDLSPWLERDRTRGPHTVLLYRRTRAALDFLRRASNPAPATPASRPARGARWPWPAPWPCSCSRSQCWPSRRRCWIPYMDFSFFSSASGSGSPRGVSCGASAPTTRRRTGGGASSPWSRSTAPMPRPSSNRAPWAHFGPTPRARRRSSFASTSWTRSWISMNSGTSSGG